MNKAGVSYLLKTQQADGGWGYGAVSTSAVEPTSAAILALRNGEAGEQILRAVQWLIAIQNTDGGWGFNAEDDRSGWVTAWAVMALSEMAEAEDAISRGRAWLSAVEIYRVDDNEVLQAFNKAIRVDFSLQGWAWGPGEASWIQPTAMALLALSGYEAEAGAQKRAEEAALYLDNRRVPGGGWNVGNPAMFAGVLPAHAIPSSLALLALNRNAPEKILPEDLEVLKQEMEFDGGAKALAYGMLALRTLGIEEPSMHQRLANMQKSDGAWEDDPFATAMALIGLEGMV